ncbi:MAG: ASCH domain-containing protein [Mesorhizobium sp.]|uniref:ASCH domain-containing protein n=1 Tax=Mesorhizobium sp. TaxID=1871066 RepID=UPI000FE49C2E|nr:ASCH domain-containing protein [Mesorhizobium sp.]RWH49464.1 MAG: ASCH domain-containing protein [Mesorhizobium sp.]
MIESIPRVALSIKQPWAELIVSRRKTVEVRSWVTSYRGRFWVHVGKRPDEGAMPLFDFSRPLFTGGYIGIAELVSIEPLNRIRWSQLRPEHLVPGPMKDGLSAWHIAGASPLRQPVAGPGQMGLFDVPDEVLAILRSSLAT